MNVVGTSVESLRVAVLVGPGQAFEDWEAALFRRLLRAPGISFEAFLEDTPDQVRDQPSPLFRLLRKMDARLFYKSRSAFGADAEMIQSIPRLTLSTMVPGVRYFDIIISHRHGSPPESALELCEQLWTYDFRENGADALGTVGFFECLEGHPVTVSTVHCYRRDGAEGVVGSCTTNTKFSASLNAQYAKSMLPPLVEKEVLREFRKCEDRFDQTTKPALAAPLPHSAPSAFDSLRYARLVFSRVGRHVLDALLRRLGAAPEMWSLVTSSGDILHSSLGNLVELQQPKGELRADPFLFEMGDDKFVFFESFTPKKGDGKIHVGQLNGDRIENIVPLDFGDAHNSYPFVFRHRDEIFMIPETHMRKRIEVWRCERFPEKWVLHATALEGKSPADTVMFEWDGQWWLLTNLSTGSFHDHCAELHVFRVDGPDLTRVEAHPLNPVVIDTTRARNGGRPFVRDGRLIRPAQNTSHGRYGYGLKFMEITSLCMETYSESEIRRIEPCTEQSTIGCHHFDSIRDLFILDARRAYGSKLFGARPIAVRPS